MTMETTPMTQAAVSPPPPVAATRTPLVDMRNINVAFGGVHAVRNVSLDLYPGEVVGLVGGNGAGKSTLTKVLSGAQVADSGEIYVDGQKATITNPRDAKVYGIECIYQTLALADNLDAPANLFLGRELTTRLGNLDDDRMEDATRKVMGRLNPNFQRFNMAVKSLSGGQRQAVAIARAIYWQAKVVLMDEPTAALAVMERDRVIAHARELAAHGTGVIYIGHNLTEILKVADRILVMHQGRGVHVTRSTDTTQEKLIKYMTGFTDSEKAA